MAKIYLTAIYNDLKPSRNAVYSILRGDEAVDVCTGCSGTDKNKTTD